MARMLRARVQSRPPSWPEPQQTLDSQTTAAFFERRLCRQYVQKLGLTSERWPANRRPTFAQHKWHFGREDECHNIPICVCKAFSGCDRLSVSNASGKQHNGNLLNGNVSIYRNIFRANSKLCWQLGAEFALTVIYESKHGPVRTGKYLMHKHRVCIRSLHFSSKSSICCSRNSSELPNLFFGLTGRSK